MNKVSINLDYMLSIFRKLEEYNQYIIEEINNINKEKENHHPGQDASIYLDRLIEHLEKEFQDTRELIKNILKEF